MRVMKELAFYIYLMLVSLAFISCKRDGKGLLTPSSSGRPYEILVVADDSYWLDSDSTLFGVLDENVPALPQSERFFHISRIRPESYNRSMRLFRNIIIVDVDKHKYTQSKFNYLRDAFSSPQMILTIQSPDRTSYVDYVTKNGDAIIDFFTKAETDREIALLKKKHNKVISERIKRIFDCDIWMFAEMNSYKEGNNFFWASTYLNDLNFVMYTYPYSDTSTFTKTYFIHKRDSVMKINIPGSESGMYMETADSNFVQTRNISVNGTCAFEVCGLWEMKNDAMGGPFVSHVQIDKKKQRVVVVEGFVYDPAHLKRDKIRKLSAALCTLRLPSVEKI